MKESKRQSFSVVNIAVWDFGGRLANYCVLFAVGVILTRLLSPAEFGAFAIVLSVISVSSTLMDLGLRSAIIQSAKVTQQQLSTILFVNLALSVALLAAFSASAELIERFYGIDGLQNYIFVASFLFVFNAITLVPSALLQKDLRLKTLSIINTLAAAISGGVAVYLAYSGFGIWTLIFQQLISAGCVVVGTVYFAKWIPSFSFNIGSIKDLWIYAWRLFASGIADTIFTRLDVFIIGKLFPIQTLGFYNRAQSLDSLVKTFSASTTASVAFPVIAKMSDDTENVRKFYDRCLNVIAFLSFLLIGILFLTCFDIVIILFTDRWAIVGNYFRIMALTGFVYPISSLMVNLIAARGNSKAFLKLELIKKAILFPTYLSFFFGGVYVFLIALGVAYIGALVLNAYFVEQEISIPMGRQLASIFKYGIVAAVAVAAVFGGTYYIDNVYIHLLVGSSSFSVLYLLFCYWFNLSGFLEIYYRFMNFYNAKCHANIPSAS